MRTRLSILALVVLVSTSAWAGDANVAYCTGESPADILDFYAQAINNRDLAAMHGVYAESFVHVPGGSNNAEPWGRDFEIESAARLFEAPPIESQQLVFSGYYTIEPGHEADTWTIDGLTMTMTTTFKDKDKAPLASADTGHRLTVRRFAEPVDHFALVKWEAPN